MNKKIACVPTEKVSMEVKAHKGFAIPEERETFLATKTVFPHLSGVLEPGVTWPAGTTVHLLGETYRHEWNRKVFNYTDPETKETTRFILVPEEMVLAVDDLTSSEVQ